MIRLVPRPRQRRPCQHGSENAGVQQDHEAAVRLTVSRGVPAHQGLLPDPETPVTVVVRTAFSRLPDQSI